LVSDLTKLGNALSQTKVAKSLISREEFVRQVGEVGRQLGLAPNHVDELKADATASTPEGVVERTVAELPAPASGVDLARERLARTLAEQYINRALAFDRALADLLASRPGRPVR